MKSPERIPYPDDLVLSKLRASFRNYPGTEADQCLVRDEIAGKSRLISEFFGGTSEDIEDPFPDSGDPESIQRYEKCVREMDERISSGFSALTDFLERDDPPKVSLRAVSFGDRRLIGTGDL
jgi:hypothetical protein